MNRYVVAIVVILVGAGLVTATGVALNQLADYQPPQHAQAKGTASTPNGVVPHVFLHLDTFPDSPDGHPQWEKEHNYHLDRNASIPVTTPHLDWVTYGPTTNLVVPAHSLVTITIDNYDGGETLLNGFYHNVRGTINNQMTVNGKTESSIPSDQVSHTFTIHGIPSNKQPWLFVNVPLQKIPDKIESAGADFGYPPHPNVITFSFMVGGPGHYVWQCEYPCGTTYNGFGGPMMTHGYMNGNFDVV